MKLYLELLAVGLNLILTIFLLLEGFKKNLLAILFFLIYGAYVLFPLILIHELSLKHGLNIEVDNYLWLALCNDIFFMAMFYFGYKIFDCLRLNISPLSFQNQYSIGSIKWLYWGIFLLLLFNNYLAGIDLIGKWLGYTNQLTYGVQGYSFFLQNLVDSLLMLTLIAYALNINWTHLSIMLIGNIFYIIPFGFRYRLIYLVIGFAIVFIYKNQLKIKNLFLISLFIISMLVATLFLGVNRTVIVGQSQGKYTFELIDLQKMVPQVRGSYVDLAIYKGIDAGVIHHDHGRSFFYYLLVRLIPSTYFDGGLKPYPPDLIRDVDRVLNLDAPPSDCPNCRIGEAQTIMGSIYYSFGFYGILVLGFFLGVITRLSSLSTALDLNFFLGLCFILSMFMFITRGYFPQVIDGFSYLVLPIFLLEGVAKLKKINLRSLS